MYQYIRNRLRGVHRIFERGEGGRIFENNEDQKQKGPHSDLARFSAQIKVKTKKKKGLHPDSDRFSVQIPKGGHDSSLCSSLCTRQHFLRLF